MFSMRNLTRHVARCPGYEFEDVVRECEHVDVLAPAPRAAGSRLSRRLRSLLHRGAADPDVPLRVAREYDLFFAFCAHVGDLQYLKRIEGLHERCRRRV